MAKGSEKKGPAIQGVVRFGGKAYAAGDEEALGAAMKDANVEALRGFGVDSTDRGRAVGRTDTQRAKIAARKAQAEAEARGEKGAASSDEEQDFSEYTLAELPEALASVTDKKVLQRAKRRDGRAGAKPLYAARLEEINAGGSGESGETDAPDDGTEE